MDESITRLLGTIWYLLVFSALFGVEYDEVGSRDIGFWDCYVQVLLDFAEHVMTQHSVIEMAESFAVKEMPPTLQSSLPFLNQLMR